MKFIACGINYTNAPLTIRERVAFTPALIPGALKKLIAEQDVNEAVILSTCNRTEIYSITGKSTCLSEWLAQHKDLAKNELSPYVYHYQDETAIKHLLRVATGIDSMLIGEPEIFGQVKQAYFLADQEGAVGTQLQYLFQTAFSLTKQVRTASGINRCPLSLAFAATQLARKMFNELEKYSVVVVGAGETIELVTMHLINQGAKRIIIANRSLENAQTLANKFAAHAISLEEIPVYLQEADIVISATSSETPIITYNTIKHAQELRRHRPLLMVDLAVPRDIAKEVAELDEVYLYNIDDLKSIVTSNLQSRTDAAKHAEAFIDIQTQLLMRKLRERNSTETICDLRAFVEQKAEEEYQRAISSLSRNEDATLVLKQFSERLMSKILHEPSCQLRQAASDGRFELLIAVRQLFGL